MNWSLQIAKPAQKDIRNLPPKDQARVKAALLAMEIDPFHGDIKRLQANPSGWRRRVRNYRIIYDVYFEQRLIVIAGVARSTSTTY
jgi:mRNA-degrading endonuclease RelE of RelBE toxin-antitoxin system